MDVSPVALPMKEAVEFWRDKVVLPPGQYNQLTDKAKLKAFAVAGIAKESELAGVFTALQKAIAKGTTFEEFKADCGDSFSRRGWTGKRAWRVDNIFRTNIQTAYSVGRYKQMQEAGVEYVQYDAVGDKRTRPTHAALDGKVFPMGHEFWDTWWPPNGFRCRCGTISVSDRQVKRRGLTVETKNPTGRLIEPLDPETGQKLPARLLMPDQGFDFNPGVAQWGYETARVGDGKWETLPGVKDHSSYRLPHIKNMQAQKLSVLDTSRLLPAGQSDGYYQAEFQKLYGKEKIVKDPAGQPVVLNLRTFLKDKTPGAQPEWKFSKRGHGTAIPLLEEILTSPDEIWLTPQRHQETGAIRLVRRYIKVWQIPKEKRIAGGFGVFEVVDGRLQGATIFLPEKKPDKAAIGYLNGNRVGLLLYKK